jgi:hypothetical protein
LTPPTAAALASLLVAGASVGGMSACGDDSEDPSTTSTPATPEVSAYMPQFQPFATCVSEQGVAPPPPTQWMAPSGVTPKLLEAARACREFLPRYGQSILDQYGSR